MTCGHVLKDHIPGSISVVFGSISIKACVVLCDEDKEVSMVRMNASSDPQRFSSIVNYPRVLWSDVEARPKGLVAILARMTDPEGKLCDNPSVYHGYAEGLRFAPTSEGKRPLHIGTADYASVRGNSGSAVFNQECRVVGIHITGRAQLTHFVCLAGVALVMTGVSSRKGADPSPSRLLWYQLCWFAGANSPKRKASWRTCRWSWTWSWSFFSWSWGWSWTFFSRTWSWSFFSWSWGWIFSWSCATST